MTIRYAAHRALLRYIRIMYVGNSDYLLAGGVANAYGIVLKLCCNSCTIRPRDERLETSFICGSSQCSSGIVAMVALRGHQQYVEKSQFLHSIIIILFSCFAGFYVGKRVIITGASRGLGKSMAVQLARAGAK